MKLILRRFVFLLVMVMIVSMQIGCQKEGPAEKAGKEVDKAFNSLKDKIEDASK